MGASTLAHTLIAVTSIAALAGCGLMTVDAEPEAVQVTAEVGAAGGEPSGSAVEPVVVAKPEPAGPAADTTVLTKDTRITGEIRPKSLAASPDGTISAHNMMYQHSVTFYDADGELKITVPDSVELSDFGITGHEGTSKGAPVEGVFTADGKHLYTSNYSMYGKGFGPEGLDSCSPGDGTDTSFVYRINVATGEIDQVIPAGAVPKFLALSPGGDTLAVTNWCTWDVTFIDTATAKPVNTVKAGRYPRGVVFAPDGESVYIASMGGDQILHVDVDGDEARVLATPGDGPRHIVASPDGEFLYVTNNGSGTIVKLNAATGEKVASASVGTQPRSMAISTDGLALYAVVYQDNKLVKLATEDLRVLDTKPTGYHPIGITYEPTKQRVWVANYEGSLDIFSDDTPA